MHWLPTAKDTLGFHLLELQEDSPMSDNELTEIALHEPLPGCDGRVLVLRVVLKPEGALQHVWTSALRPALLTYGGEDHSELR